MLLYRDLGRHKDSEIKSRWLIFGEDEFGRMFQGIKPNRINGMDVLEGQ